MRLVLLHRVAALYEEVLDDKPTAITAYKNVLGVDDTDLAALDALERLYRATGGDARELAQTLERKIELTTDLRERQALRHAAAQVYEEQLDDIYQAIGQLTAILDDDAGDAGALAELDRIYAQEKMWPELLDVVDRRALLAISARDRADLAFRAAAPRRARAHRSRRGDPALRRGAAGPAGARRGARRARGADGEGRATSRRCPPILERVYRARAGPSATLPDWSGSTSAGSRSASATAAPTGRALADVHETLAGAPVAGVRRVGARASRPSPTTPSS